MPDAPPAGLATVEAMVAAWPDANITLPAAMVRELIAWARAMERRLGRGRLP